METNDTTHDEFSMQCKDCEWYRPQWRECCFGGGWGHYPYPEDWCERYYAEQAKFKNQLKSKTI